MIWTDRVFITAEELTRVDSEVPEVVTAEGITMGGPNGLIRGAIEEAGDELMKYLVGFGGFLGSGDVSANHSWAVQNTGVGTMVRHKALPCQVIVSGDTAESWNNIHRWASFWALQIFYRNAFNRTVKDRYEGKMRYYKSELVRRITPSLWGLGIPVVNGPLAAPGATFERDAGTWDSSNLSLVAGSGTATTMKDVVVTYVDMGAPLPYVDSSDRGNSESHQSEIVQITPTSGNVISVNISSLNPPTGRQHPSQQIKCVIPMRRATHWNVYAGEADGTLYLQNAAPIAITTTSFDFPGNPLTSGPKPGLGQYADRILTLNPTRQRA